MATALENVDELVCELNATNAAARESSHTGQGFKTGPSARVSIPFQPVSKPLGYQRRSAEQAPWPPEGKSGPGWQSPKPLPKRPTGRFFVGGLLACISGAMIWHVWNTFFSVVAYGLVTGDTLTISAPWEATIADVHFREGESIAQGDILITLASTKLDRRLDRLQDELSIEKAKLGAESMRLRQEGQAYTAQYFQMWATLQKSREELLRMQQELEQIRSVGDSEVISQQALNRLTFSESGQREFVEKITSALDALRHRAVDDEAPENQASQAQLQPLQARIDYLNGEIRRTRNEIREGEIRSPVAGVVARCPAIAGQAVTSNECLMEIVDRDSLKIEMFVPQHEIDRYAPGKVIKLSIAPQATPLICTVVGSRNRFESAPLSIQQFYNNRETLLPVILTPRLEGNAQRLFVGSVTKFTLWQSLLEE